MSQVWNKIFSGKGLKVNSPPSCMGRRIHLVICVYLKFEIGLTHHLTLHVQEFL